MCNVPHSSCLTRPFFSVQSLDAKRAVDLNSLSTPSCLCPIIAEKNAIGSQAFSEHVVFHLKRQHRYRVPNLIEKLAFACHLKCQLVCCSVPMHLRVKDVMMQIQEEEILHDLGMHFPGQSTIELRW